MTITVKLLKSLNACQEEIDNCQEQIEKFQEIFGDEASLTVEAAVDNASALDWDWIAQKVLNDKNLEEYLKARKPFLDEYEKAIKPFWDQYLKAIKPFLDECLKTRKPFWDQYLKARKPFLDEYTKNISRLFAELHIKQVKETP